VSRRDIKTDSNVHKIYVKYIDSIYIYFVLYILRCF